MWTSETTMTLRMIPNETGVELIALVTKHMKENLGIDWRASNEKAAIVRDLAETLQILCDNTAPPKPETEKS